MKHHATAGRALESIVIMKRLKRKKCYIYIHWQRTVADRFNYNGGIHYDTSEYHVNCYLARKTVDAFEGKGL